MGTRQLDTLVLSVVTVTHPGTSYHGTVIEAIITDDPFEHILLRMDRDGSSVFVLVWETMPFLGGATARASDGHGDWTTARITKSKTCRI